MQDFFITYKGLVDSESNFKSWNSVSNNLHTLYFISPKHEFIENGDSKIVIIGDYWGEELLKNSPEKLKNFEQVIKTLKGNYYYFIIEDNSVQVISGFLNLCPIYYSQQYKFATSSFDLIIQMDNKMEISERYILETFLFNYPFFNTTIYKQVLLLSSHSVLIFNDSNLKEKSFWNASNLFVPKPASTKKDYKLLVSKFIKTVDEYVPQQKAAISFTGGFDGRTIVATALHLNKKFNTFSFGKSENDDVYIPKKNAVELNLNFKHINAGESNYINASYSENALEMSIQSGGFNGFLYPHFLYMAKVLTPQNDYLITGYGGSELLRATHIMGAITSKALYQVITIDERNVLKQALLANQSIKVLSQKIVDENIEALLEDLMNYKESLRPLNTLNIKLYAFLMNETMRKIFGVWQTNQTRYIRVRSPFLDYSFIESVYKTNLAGVYNDFYTENPLKRFKGQLLYALILKETNKTIYHQKTGKGYAPVQLLTIVGKMKMIIPFFTKRLKRKIKTENLNNLSIISGLKQYIQNTNKEIDTRYFDKNKVESAIATLTPDTAEQDRDALLNYFSITSITQREKNNSPHRL